MKKVSVESSLIASVGYDKDTQKLHVWLNNGLCYVYDDVPSEVFETLIASESVGQTFGRLVKTKYTYTLVASE